MELSRPWQALRDALAVFVTGLFMFPIFWWALTSIKPISAVFDKDKILLPSRQIPTRINERNAAIVVQQTCFSEHRAADREAVCP